MEHVDYNIFNSWAKNHVLNDNMFDNNGNII